MMIENPPFRLTCPAGDIESLSRADFDVFRALGGSPRAHQRIDLRASAVHPHPLIRWQTATFLAHHPHRFRMRDSFCGEEDAFLLLWEGEIARADSEGVVWTPVLDELARASSRPDGVDVERRAEQLTPWIHEHPGLDLEALLEFRSPIVHRLVARYGRELTGDMVARMCVDPELASALLDNPERPEDAHERVVRHAYEKWRSLAGPGNRHGRPRRWGTRLAGREAHRHLVSLVEEHGLPPSLREELANEPEALGSEETEVLLADPECPPPTLRSLALREGTSPNLAALTHPNAERALVEDALLRYRDYAPLYTRVISGAIPAYRGDESLLWQALRRWPNSVPVAESVAQHPDAGPDILLHILESLSGHSLGEARKRLSTLPVACRDRRLAEALMESTSPEVLANLMADTTPPDVYERLFSRLRGRDPDLLWETIMDRGVPQGATIPRAFLESKLSSSNASDRRVALSILGASGRGRSR